MHAPRTRGHHGMNYYQVLGLAQPNKSNLDVWSSEDVKAAYHRTLLLHHPDKVAKFKNSSSTVEKTQSSGHRFSIDEIVLAYHTLASPGLKREYDILILRDSSRSRVAASELSQRETHLGVETYDLDDLDYNEAREQWTRSCRCGDRDGYTVTEGELEKVSKEGEVYVGCHGCSLFIKVLFGVAAEQNNTARGELDS